MVENINFINPTKNGFISDVYGYRINPILEVEEFHNGIDIGVVVGTEVLAVSDGEVIEINTSPTYGNYIKFNATNDYIVMYAHLEKALVAEGEKIKQGQVVALSGDTGLSTGPHLHYTIWKDEETINPINFVNYEN